MADEREEEMLALMRDCTERLRQLQNTINEIWAEWTRTHGLRGGVSQPKALTPDMDPAKAEQCQGSNTARKVKRVLR